MTLDATPELVLRMARTLARRYAPWGALDRDDYVSLACLGFYEARERWSGTGNFKRYALRWMDGEILQARRREARHHEGYMPKCRTEADRQRHREESRRSYRRHRLRILQVRADTRRAVAA